MKGNLASIHDIEEYHEIQRLVMTATHEFTVTWVGGSDAQEENQWLWSDGTSFQFTNWCPGEPNNLYQQHCLTINNAGQKCWDDYQCRSKKPFICAKKA
ncbi:hypothetical protein CHARACLAT_033158 [Characodon lateralis]|uniref:C-type lectin domain-containing protein n=1 Tax=Characodon lateralis TaxID=208331 RepID=A0ABU7DZM5_9TELE|nr:hypothetical protein [Characodon lateralis]